MNKSEILSAILRKINGISDVEGAAIVTRDGLLIVSEISSSVDSETFAAMSATMFAAAETALSELKKGGVERVLVESKETKLVLVGAGETAILILMVNPISNIGLVLVEVKKAAAKIKKAI